MGTVRRVGSAGERRQRTRRPEPVAEIILAIMDINDFIILPGSKAGTSVRLKAKTVRELQLEKVKLETETQEMEKKLQELQSIMSREKDERKRSSAYHWKSGQAGATTIQARVLPQRRENNNKVPSGKQKLQILKDQVQEPAKAPFQRETANAVAHEKSTVKGRACGLCEIKSALPELPADTACTGLGNAFGGYLLKGTFCQEEPAESFGAAVLQRRAGHGDGREEPCTREAVAELLGFCDVQTSLTVVKEPFQIEFKDGPSYLEKLLLKKYRRTPVDQISSSFVKDLRPGQTPNVHQAVTRGAGGGGDDEYDDDDVVIDDLTAEDVKRYWTSVFRAEVPNTPSESAESSVKIEFLDDSYGKDLEEPSDFLGMEAGAVGVDKQGKTESLTQFGRNPVSSTGISQDQMVVCRHRGRNAVQQESIRLRTMKRSISSCKVPKKISNPSHKYLHKPQLQKTSKQSQELPSVCSSQSLVLPVVTEALADVASRQKSVSTRYWGLEGFLVVGANPKQVLPEARSSLRAGSSPVDSSVPFPGSGKWVAERSLSEYADDSVVQGVSESHLNRPSGGSKTQKRDSPQMAAWGSHPGNDSRRPQPTNRPHHKVTGDCPADAQLRPKSSPVRVLGADTEMPKPKCFDAAQQDEALWEALADQEALLALEKELRSYTGPRECYRVTFVGSSSSRRTKKVCSNTTALLKHLELRDCSRADALGGWDESQVDDEDEILEDKQQVLALQ